MKLRFNVGAIIEVTLYGNAEQEKLCGKVINVLDDEIQLIPQLRIKEDMLSIFDEYKENYSADVPGEPIHLNRQLVKSWRYIKANELSSKGAICKAKDRITGLSVDDCLPLNQYDDAGYCKGTGIYCGDIEEHYVSPIIIAVNKSSDNDDESL